jgi:hypothetical protein
MRLSITPGNDPTPVECGTEALGAVVANQSGGPVYYRSLKTVSATQADGVLASGASTTLFGQQWLFVASGSTRAEVDVAPIAATTDPYPLSIGQVVATGHSILAGDGASDTTRDIMTRLASMMNAKEYNWAKGGACLMWVNDASRGEYGVLPSFLQAWKRPVRAASVLSAGSSIGATTIAVTPDPSAGSTTGPAFKVGDTICIGSGANAEIAMVASVTTTNINIYASATNETYSLVRAHNSGDPVYAVPGHYGAGNTIFLLCEAGNQIARYGTGVYANSVRWYQDAQRMLLSRMRAAEEFNPDHTALTFSGSWGSAVVSSAQSGSTAAQGGRNPTAPNAAVTFNMPDNFPGGAVSFNTASLAGNTGGGVWTFTVDGVAAGTMTTVACPTVPVNKTAYFCKRFTGLSAGRHTIVATMTTLETNNYFDSFIIEAIDPPVIVMFRAHRLLSWDVTSSTFDYGHIRPLLASAANVGDTSISVNQSPFASSRQLAAGSIPKAGEILVIEPTPGDVAPQEVRTVTSVTGTGPFTINFSGGGLVRSHATGTRCELGIKDYDARNIVNPLIDAGAQEFDGSVLIHDADPYIQKQAKWFGPDYAHFTDEGNALVAEKLYRQLATDPHVSPRLISRLSRPIQTAAVRVSFLDGNATGIAWTSMPAALSEFPLTTNGNGNYRRVADLTRYYEARVGCVQTVIGAGTAKLRIAYSIDQGTTWHYLHRKRHATDPQFTSTDWSESSAASDVMCQIDLTSTLPTNGVKYTSFEPIYPEVMQQQYQDTMLRVVGIGGNGAASPAFASIWVEFR